MKRNNLTTAVVAGLAGVAGLASVSNATVSLNSDGLGQALIYPYYTVNNDLLTLFSVVNTTNHTKAVKVRFLEGKNSREVLDFNLYLSPYDVWTANLQSAMVNRGPLGIFTGDPAYDVYNDDETTVLKTTDTSCTVPVINGHQFKPFEFHGDPVSLDNMSRGREGHIEVLEMGIVDPTTVTADNIEHDVSGVPRNCGDIVGRWYGTGAWLNVPIGEDNMLLDFGPNNVYAGGLYGTVAIVDVINGFEISYNADAIQGYKTAIDHTNPGDLKPTIGDIARNGLTFDSVIFTNGGVQATSWQTGVEAMSALYMHDNIYNDYVLSDSLAAKTEWVVTFPTKKFYVDDQYSNETFGVDAPYDPFTVGINSSGACEPMGAIYYNREEGQPDDPNCPVGTIEYLDPETGALSCISPPSPLPPDPPETPGPSLCWETNVVEFTSDEAALSSSVPSVILGSVSKRAYFIAENETLDLDEDTNWSAGWARLSFSQSTSYGETTVGGAPQTYTGLPVTGFAVQRLTNVAEGKLFGTIFKHKASRNITS